jgi:hypothetical protein
VYNPLWTVGDGEGAWQVDIQSKTSMAIMKLEGTIASNALAANSPYVRWDAQRRSRGLAIVSDQANTSI